MSISSGIEASGGAEGRRPGGGVAGPELAGGPPGKGRPLQQARNGRRPGAGPEGGITDRRGERLRQASPPGAPRGPERGPASDPGPSGRLPGMPGLPGLPEWARPWVPRLAALMTLADGLLDIISAVTPEWRSRLDHLRVLLPASVSRQAAAFTVVVGMLLVLLALGLRRRKQRAWRAVVILLGASIVLHVAKGLDYEEASGSAALLAALLLTRQEFQAKGDPATRWRALGLGLFLAVVSLGTGLLLLHVQERRIAGPHPLSAELEQIAEGLIGIPGPLHFTSDRFSDLADRMLLTMGVLTIAATAYLALRPPEPRPRLTEEDEVRLRALLDRHGEDDSLGYFALRGDKSAIWSPTGKACVAYRVVSGVMLASGDPIGDREAWPGAIKEFLREAAEHAWTPAVIGCSEAGGTAWTRAGLSALEFGDEAIVETAEFSLEGRAMRNVRQAVARVERAGYTALVRRTRDIPPDEVERLKAQAAVWRGTETERGFSMALGRIADPADGDCVTVMAFSAAAEAPSAGAAPSAAPAGPAGSSGPADPAAPAGPAGSATSAPSAGSASPAAGSVASAGPDGADPRLRAVLHFVPWGRTGLSLDAMVRDRKADNGLNEFLIVSTLRGAPDLGIKRLSLNFAFFRSALERGERLGAGPVIRVWRGLLMFLSRWFQIDSLYRFNAKFQPAWQPRYVCFPSSSGLPRIALAMLEAEAFLVWPCWDQAKPWLRRLPGARRLPSRPSRPGLSGFGRGSSLGHPRRLTRGLTARLRGTRLRASRLRATRRPSRRRPSR